MLDKVHQILKPGGLLVLEVPSSDSVLVRYYETYGGYIDRIIEGDRHIMLFSVRALKEMTQRAGFDLVHLPIQRARHRYADAAESGIVFR